jgi:hypothetical protein
MKIHVKFKKITEKSWSSPQGYDWGAVYKFNIEAVSLKRPLVEYETLNIAGPVAYGDRVWVLHIVYNEADSFGCATGNGEIIWVFCNEQMARSAAASIERDKEATSFQFGDDDGTIIQLSSPISYHEERITDVVLTPVIVSESIQYNYTH